MSDTAQGAPAPELSVDDVLNTVGYEGFVKSLFNWSEDPAKNFAHAVLGVVTEEYEAKTAKDDVNLVEELGDLRFYTEVLRQIAGIDPRRAFIAALLVVSNRVAEVEAAGGGIEAIRSRLCNELLDMAKRWVGYGKAPDLITATGLAMFVTSAVVPEHRLAEPQFGLENVTRTNVAKLLKRYNGMQFSADKAVNRDTAAERVVLEQTA